MNSILQRGKRNAQPNVLGFHPRRLLRGLLLLTLLFALSPGLLPADALAGDSYVEGEDYDLIQPPVPMTGQQPQIQEIFNFTCPHCFHLHPVMAAWAEANAERFDVHATPIHWPNQSDLPTRAFYAAQFLGAGPAMKDLIFKAQFEDGLDIEEIDTLIYLAEEAGLDPARFQSTLNDFAVIAKVSQARALANAAGVRGTPTIVVQGRYRVTGSHSDEGWPGMLKIVEALAER